MQTKPPTPSKKKGIPSIIVIVPAVIVALAAFLLIMSLVIRGMGFRSIESREDVSEEPLPERRVYSVNLYIQSNVGGAEVYINGEMKAVTRSSDLKASIFGLKPGKYEIKLKKAGYKDAVETIELKDDRPVVHHSIELSKENAP